jgi:hypothetical protein
MPTDDDPVQDLLTHPNPARIYDVWLGGKDNLAVDRDIAARVAEAAPHVVAGVRAFSELRNDHESVVRPAAWVKVGVARWTAVLRRDVSLGNS